MGSGSINFDAAVDYYDETRSVAPDTERRVVAVLAAELAARGRCLEIGVGTGRVALALDAAGVAMAGVDISSRMLHRLVEKAGGHPPFPLALADATALPFGDASVGAALAAHVLHLIPTWERAVGELCRVVAPGGVVLASLTGGMLETSFPELRDRFAAASGLTRLHVGVVSPAELDEAFGAMGASLRLLPEVAERRALRLEDLISRLEQGTFSFTWRIDEAVRRQAAETVRAWARSEFGSLDEPVVRERAIVWRAYDLPS